MFSSEPDYSFINQFFGRSWESHCLLLKAGAPLCVCVCVCVCVVCDGLMLDVIFAMCSN